MTSSATDNKDPCSNSPYVSELNSTPLKYLVVTGGTLSGVGKGTTISCIGVVLKSMGFRVTAIKIDPYLNVDAGTMSPYEHGEVFVLQDGGEVDLDLGNYERFLDITLTRNHNITTGKIYEKVLREEREGKFLGKTVQVVPHVTDAIQDWISNVSHLSVDSLPGRPDICLIEVGGTVGDIESSMYLEALQQFFCKVGTENFCLCHVSFVPVVGSGDHTEQKTKPTQHSIKELRQVGLRPDFVFCRSAEPLDSQAKQKIALFGQVSPESVISVHNLSNLYHVPLLIYQQHFGKLVCDKLRLTPSRSCIDSTLPIPIHLESTLQGLRSLSPTDDTYGSLSRWEFLANRLDKSVSSVRIGIVGKYTGLTDSYLSVLKGLTHASIEANLNLEIVWIESSSLESNTEDKEAYTLAWEKMNSVDGVLCPGGFGDRGILGKMASSTFCREKKVPYFGICLGMQTAIIEFCRNELGLAEANSEEFNKDTPHKVVMFMPEVNATIMGGTMRLGNRPTIINDKTSLVYQLYDNQTIIYERHRHRYEINPQYVSAMEKKGLKFVGRDKDGQRMEIVELDSHPFFLCTQFHPEFTSRPMHPNPCFLGFILASKQLLHKRLESNHNCLLSGSIYNA